MAFVEILNYGKLPGSPAAEPGVISRTNGINQELAHEVVRLCKDWGQPPLFGEFHPAILSFPLKSKASFAPKGAFAVIMVQGSPDALFQVAVLNRADFAAFGYNPFAVVEAGAFPVWDAKAIPGRRKLKTDAGPLELSPPPSPEDVGMVDEALHQLLTSHKLYLPIGKPTVESDRCLALLIEVLPEALKQQLRFASYAPTTANGYHLAATETAGCEFAGWQRLMMTLVGGALPENLDRYVKKVRDCLAFGDLGVIREESRILSLGRQSTETKQPPVPPVRTPVVTPVVAAVSKPKVSSPGKLVNKQPFRRSGTSSNLAQLRGGRRQLPGAVVGLLVLAVTLGCGWTYLEFFNGGSGIQWNELVSLPGQNLAREENQVASLLEVPNVGSVYHSQIKKIHRAGMIPGLNQETDQRRGLVNLKTDAAVPLLSQVDLFLDLSAAGIRQGSRPDRESERLQALANQGKVLKVELSRLELGWHSLSSGVNWEDLKNLSDIRVEARRDSLRKDQPSALRAAAADMNFGDRLKKLDVATGQVAGMSQLLVLFQATQWTENWSVDLYRAAERVSPAASAITRAYRNCAFTLIRLKNAEHTDAFAASPFVDKLDKGVWPGEKVADILPGLRREIGKFSSNEAPPLLAGTLQLYEILEDPVTLMAGLESDNEPMELLVKNAAVLFDPEVYENYLERLRYQAGLQNPGLYSEKERGGLVAFASLRQGSPSASQWEEQIANQNIPFLKRWARHERLRTQQALLSDLSGFDETCGEVDKLAEKLRSQAGLGSDWTAVWVDLDKALDRGLTQGGQLLPSDPSVGDRVQDLRVMKAQLGETRNLSLGMVTVRLDQKNPAGLEKVVLEFQVLPQGKIYRSEPFNIGPAAPAGSGWVGTWALAAGVQISPHHAFQATVRSLDGDRELLSVQYPSLRERVGPGALARPRPGDGGSLIIKTDDSWWRGITLPGKKDRMPAS